LSLDYSDVVAGERRWQAFVNAAASGGGADYPVRDDLPHPVDTYPKFMAQLDYTTADVEYLSGWWRNDPGYPPMLGTTLVTRLEPDHGELVRAFDEAEAWLVEAARDESNFDGGGLVFSFSGHGRAGDGTLLLRDSTYFSAEDFLEQAIRIHRATGSRHPTRVVLLLDSCCSGAFLVHVVHRILHEPGLGLDCEYILASSHPDEASWESPALGHGLSTYCFSLREAAVGSEIGVAGRNEIRTWSTYAGPHGCSIATAAAQNPIVYRGSGLETCFTTIEESWESEEKLLEALKVVRDDLYERFTPFRRWHKSDLSEGDIDRDVLEQLEMTSRVDDDQPSVEERAEALRAYRRAWWVDPHGRWS